MMNLLGRLLLLPLAFLLAMPVATMADDDMWMPTPARLSYTNGQVSWWRPGAPDWAQAGINLPMTEGDALYAGRDSSFELQIGSRSYVRADESSELSLVNQDEHFMQFRVMDGLVSFDIRNLADGDTIEVDTPNAVFTIDHPGYYRVDVDGQTTHFITYHGGRAIVTTADGRSQSIFPSEDVVITGDQFTSVATYAAPPPDGWDHWNDERSDYLADSISSRYLPPGVYGVDDLDHYGYWRVVPEYGPVWIPNDVAPDWTPYSDGYWTWDPYYEWTWVDNKPWGWAPFHYGRWVSIDGRWCWAPGPINGRPVYSPALVAFMVRDHGLGINLSVGTPGLFWVALGWGEPVIPWWGPRDYRGHPHWNGWHGPRISFNVTNYRYRNAGFPRAVLGAPDDRFGRERFRIVPEANFHHDGFAPVRGALPIRPDHDRLTGGVPRGIQPPHEIFNRPVVSSQPPRERPLPWMTNSNTRPAQPGPVPRIVITPRLDRDGMNNLPRPPFGRQGGQERTPTPFPANPGMMPKTAPPAREVPHQQGPASGSQPVRTRQSAPDMRPTQAPSTIQRTEPKPGMQRERSETRREVRERPLPGNPASQMYREQDHRERRWERPDRDSGRDGRDR